MSAEVSGEASRTRASIKPILIAPSAPQAGTQVNQARPLRIDRVASQTSAPHLPQRIGAIFAAQQGHFSLLHWIRSTGMVRSEDGALASGLEVVDPGSTRRMVRTA